MHPRKVGQVKVLQLVELERCAQSAQSRDPTCVVVALRMSVVCTYEIQIPRLHAADALPPAALAGAFEAASVDGGRLRVRDVLAAFPFEGRWHLRAQFSPPGEGHVYFDLTDPAAPVPLLPDGTASLRALPLGALVAGAPGACAARGPAEWAWGAEDFAAWAAARRVAAAAAAVAVAAEGCAPSPRASPDGESSPTVEEPSWREDGELREGGAAARSLGAAAGEAAEAASAAASAALTAAASAAANAAAAVSSFFSGARRG